MTARKDGQIWTTLTRKNGTTFLYMNEMKMTGIFKVENVAITGAYMNSYTGSYIKLTKYSI